MRGAQHAEHPLQPRRVHHVPNSDQVEVAGRNPNHQVVLPHDAQDEIQLLLALDRPGFDVFDHGGTVIGVNDGLTNSKSHDLLGPFLRMSVARRVA